MIVAGDPNTETASIFLRNKSSITHATTISLAAPQKSESLVYTFVGLVVSSCFSRSRLTCIHLVSMINMLQQAFRLQANAQSHGNNAFRHGVQSHDAVWPHLNLNSPSLCWTLQRHWDGWGLPLEISKAIAVQVSKNTMPSKDEAGNARPSYYIHR